MTNSTGVISSGPTKHYEVLDGLRGVASVIVVAFHILEIFAGGDHTKQLINHGYLAVDFFFLLSGFVIAHAYDDRWNTMTLAGFFKRRLIRLHPLIIVGMIMGAILFYPSASAMFAPVADTPVWKLIGVMLLGAMLIPVPVSLDIKGWWEMYPLNGPAWSLFFEYIANLCYALFLRKLSIKLLSLLVLVSAVLLVHFAVTNPKGDVIGGWSITGEQLRIGFTRLAFPFLAGLLLRRLFKPGSFRISNTFFWCSLAIALLLALPRVAADGQPWINGIYDSLVIIILFPLLVYIAASGTVKGKFAQRACTFLGDISYPLYITHFPVLYVYYAWISNKNASLKDAWPVGAMVFVLCIAIAYLFLRFYDQPVRSWLNRRYGNSKDGSKVIQ
jgi:peptidoglycan/LPS O-acetylase OafA/YrhL